MAITMFTDVVTETGCRVRLADAEGVGLLLVLSMNSADDNRRAEVLLDDRAAEALRSGLENRMVR